MNKTRNIINSCLTVVFIIEILKTVVKNKSLPSLRFFFGSGITYLLMGLLSEFADDLARDLTVAITTFVVLTDGSDVLTEVLKAAPTTSTSGSVAKNAPAFGNPGQSPQSNANALGPIAGVKGPVSAITPTPTSRSAS